MTSSWKILPYNRTGLSFKSNLQCKNESHSALLVVCVHKPVLIDAIVPFYVCLQHLRALAGKPTDPKLREEAKEGRDIILLTCVCPKEGTELGMQEHALVQLLLAKELKCLAAYTIARQDTS